jgi:hypothetical protein
MCPLTMCPRSRPGLAALGPGTAEDGCPHMSRSNSGPLLFTFLLTVAYPAPWHPYRIIDSREKVRFILRAATTCGQDLETAVFSSAGSSLALPPPPYSAYEPVEGWVRCHK